MKNKIIKIANELFDTQITINSKIGDIEKWDSLGQINLFMTIEAELGISFNPDEIIENDSIVKIINLLKDKELNK